MVLFFLPMNHPDVEKKSTDIRRKQKLSVLIWSVPLLLFVILNFAIRGNATTDREKGTSPDHAAAVLDQQKPAGDTLWVDVRTPDEYAAGRLIEAVNIPLDLFEEALPHYEPDKNRTIALYCRSGGRASRALAIAQKLGYRSVFNAGGYSDLSRSRQK